MMCKNMCMMSCFRARVRVLCDYRSRKGKGVRGKGREADLGIFYFFLNILVIKIFYLLEKLMATIYLRSYLSYGKWYCIGASN